MPFRVTTVSYTTDSPSDNSPPPLLLPDVGFSLLGFSTPLIYPLHRLPLAAGLLTQIVFAVILCFPTLQTDCSVPIVFGVFTHFASLFFHSRRGAREFALLSLDSVPFINRYLPCGTSVLRYRRVFRVLFFCSFTLRILRRFANSPPSFFPSSCVADDSFVKKEFRVSWK